MKKHIRYILLTALILSLFSSCVAAKDKPLDRSSEGSTDKSTDSTNDKEKPEDSTDYSIATTVYHSETNARLTTEELFVDTSADASKETLPEEIETIELFLCNGCLCEKETAEKHLLSGFQYCDSCFAAITGGHSAFCEDCGIVITGRQTGHFWELTGGYYCDEHYQIRVAAEEAAQRAREEAERLEKTKCNYCGTKSLTNVFVTGPGYFCLNCLKEYQEYYVCAFCGTFRTPSDKDKAYSYSPFVWELDRNDCSSIHGDVFSNNEIQSICICNYCYDKIFTYDKSPYKTIYGDGSCKCCNNQPRYCKTNDRILGTLGASFEVIEFNYGPWSASGYIREQSGYKLISLQVDVPVCRGCYRYYLELYGSESAIQSALNAGEIPLNGNLERPYNQEDPYYIAKSLIGHEISELYEVIGEPIGQSPWAPCLDGPGYEGWIEYEGFTVYYHAESETECYNGAAIVIKVSP